PTTPADTRRPSSSPAGVQVTPSSERWTSVVGPPDDPGVPPRTANSVNPSSPATTMPPARPSPRSTGVNPSPPAETATSVRPCTTMSRSSSSTPSSSQVYVAGCAGASGSQALGGGPGGGPASSTSGRRGSVPRGTAHPSPQAAGVTTTPSAVISTLWPSAGRPPGTRDSRSRSPWTAAVT